MNATPSLSIVIPVYNAGPYLVACLDSIYSQGVPENDFEVIAVDDGSDDGSGPQLDAYAQTHGNMRVFHQTPSGSPAAPRNVGIERACGTYVFFVDADDYLCPQALENMLLHAEETGCDLGLFKIDRSEWGSDYSGLFERSRMNCTLDDAPLMSFLGPTKLYRRSLLVEHGIRFPLHARCEDHPFAIECYFAARSICVFADRDYYHYRKRDDGRSATMGQLSESFDGAEARFAGCANHFAALDAHTSVHERPALYERGLRTCARELRAMPSSTLESGELSRYRTLVGAHCTPAARGFLSLGNMVLLDALLEARDAPAAVLAARDIAGSGAMFEPTRGGYRLLDADGTALFASAFAAEGHIGPKLAAPQLAVTRVTEATWHEGGTLELTGTAFVFCADAPAAGTAALRVRTRKTSAHVDFACSTRVVHDDVVYGTVRYWQAEWRGAIALRQCTPLLAEREKALLDLYFVYEAQRDAIRQLRLGKTRGPQVAESFLAPHTHDDVPGCTAFLTGPGNFSLRLQAAPHAEGPAADHAEKRPLVGALQRVKRALRKHGH